MDAFDHNHKHHSQYQDRVLVHYQTQNMSFTPASDILPHNTLEPVMFLDPYKEDFRLNLFTYNQDTITSYRNEPMQHNEPYDMQHNIPRAVKNALHRNETKFENAAHYEIVHSHKIEYRTDIQNSPVIVSTVPSQDLHTQLYYQSNPTIAFEQKPNPIKDEALDTLLDYIQANKAADPTLPHPLSVVSFAHGLTPKDHTYNTTAAILNVGWKHAEMREAVCDFLKPETKGQDPFERLVDVAADNAMLAVKTFVNQKADAALKHSL